MSDENMVTMEAEAVREALRLRSEQEQWQGLNLRLYLEGKGCDGFYYGITFSEDLEQDHRICLDADAGLYLLVDPDITDFVQGSNITWNDNELGRGFLVDNPRQKKFRGKFFKRQKWLERLQKRGEGSEHEQV